MYICIYVYVYIYMYTYIYKCTHTHIYIHTYARALRVCWRETCTFLMLLFQPYRAQHLWNVISTGRFGFSDTLGA